MSVKEEIAKLTAGQLLTLILGLLGSLILIVLQGTLFLLWTRIEPEISKRTLEATLALVSIAGTILLVAVLTLLFLLFRQHRMMNEPKMTKRFGVLWDKELNPHCPVDETLMRVRVHQSDRDYDILMCPKSEHKYPLRKDDGTSLLLPEAQDLVAGKERHLVFCGLLWDANQNPLCPVCQTPLYIGEHLVPADGCEHDVLGCPKCHHKYPIRQPNIGLLTLADAVNEIVQRGLVKKFHK